MRKRMIKTYSIVILIVVAVVFILGCALYKPPIQEATIEELQEIDGIGLILSNRVVSYLDCNPSADVDDLTDIYGIGEEKLKLLRRHYK